MKGRTYDPMVDRFLTPDPVVHAPLKRQDLNRYSYAWNNPLKVTDLTGYTEDSDGGYDDYGYYDDFDDGDLPADEGPADYIYRDEAGEQHHEFDAAMVYASPSDDSVSPVGGLPEGPNPDDFPDDPEGENGKSYECEVALCSRAADLPGGELMAAAGIYHQWIRTPYQETGMGKRGEGVPGATIPAEIRTTLNDHSGEGAKAGSVCTPLCGISTAEIEGRMAVGTPTGPWLPLVNDCNNVVEDALVKSGANPDEVGNAWHIDAVHAIYKWFDGD